MSIQPAKKQKKPKPGTCSDCGAPTCSTQWKRCKPCTFKYMSVLMTETRTLGELVKDPKVQARFYAKINKVGDPPGCWLWTAYRIPEGYGRVKLGRTLHLAHRVSYEMHIGPIPKDLCVLHHCDVPGCVNPAHLFVGTHRDNRIDCVSKGRNGKPGDRNWGQPAHDCTTST